jgi:hypothetical protein
VRSVSIGLVITPLLAALTGPLPLEHMGEASTVTIDIIQPNQLSRADWYTTIASPTGYLVRLRG